MTTCNTRAANLKAYFLPNIDGSNSALVAAPNQKAACELMGCSMHSFRTYGGQVVEYPEMVLLAFAEPGRVWYCRLQQYGSNTEWRLFKRRH